MQILFLQPFSFAITPYAISQAVRWAMSVLTTADRNWTPDPAASALMYVALGAFYLLI